MRWSLLGLAACSLGPDRVPSEAVAPTVGQPTPTLTTGNLPVFEAFPCTDSQARNGQHFDRHVLPPLESTEYNLMGGGVGVADFDGDGWLDLLITGETQLQLWRGTGDPAAPFVHDPARLANVDLDHSVGAIPADLDADGLMDVIISRWDRPNAILVNTGTELVDATPAPLLGQSWRTQAATAADLDGDGDLDLFFGGYGSRPRTSFDPKMPAADPAELYRNDGAGSWTDISSTLQQPIHDGYTFAVGFYDTTGDGLPEAFVANDFGEVRPSLQLINQGDSTFEVNADWHPDSEDMGLGVGDVNEDGVPDFLVTSAVVVSALASGEAYGTEGIWVDSSLVWGMIPDRFTYDQWFGWGAEWLDIDNDMDLDGIALFGRWTDWVTVPEQEDALWLQVSDIATRFDQVARDPAWSQADRGAGRGVLAVDLNRDGWLDLVKRQVGQETLIDLSRCGVERSLQVALVGPAVGARVEAVTGGRVQTRWITAGGSSLYVGGPPIAHFGLGTLTRVDEVVIHWPDGEVQRLEDVLTGGMLTVTR